MADHTEQQATPILTIPDHCRIGLALSGGATRGIAHIGALKALIESNIRIDYISGTSIGALVGAFYAFGIPIDTIRRQAEEMSWLSIASLTIPKNGLLSNRIIGDIVEKHLGNVHIEDSPIPLAIIATDIATGEKITIRKGNLARAIMASTCIPGVFTPIKFEGLTLVDGFLVENVPVSPLKEMGADVIISICLSMLRQYREPKGIVNILLNAYEIAIDTSTLATLKDTDILIVPNLTAIPPDDEGQQFAMYTEGYTAGLLSIGRIDDLIQEKYHPKRLSFWKRFLQRFNGRRRFPGDDVPVFRALRSGELNQLD